MYFTIYEITNTINGKTYIGMHKTNNLEDGYMGSGTLLKLAIEKYGIENFRKTILKLCDSQDEMLCSEAELVNEEYVNRRDTYNLNLGGQGGGYYHINTNGLGMSSEKSKMMLQRKMEKLSPERRSAISRGIADGCRDRGVGLFAPNVVRCDWNGRTHSEDTKIKMREAKTGLYKGENNPQYGTMWITNGEINKKAKKTDPIPQGWVRGRKIHQWIGDREAEGTRLESERTLKQGSKGSNPF